MKHTSNRALTQTLSDALLSIFIIFNTVECRRRSMTYLLFCWFEMVLYKNGYNTSEEQFSVHIYSLHSWRVLLIEICHCICGKLSLFFHKILNFEGVRILWAVPKANSILCQICKHEIGVPNSFIVVTNSTNFDIPLKHICIISLPNLKNLWISLFKD